ncbi:TonB-dependent siderophore receptor [Ferrimonas sp. YFM]|uniref:TonB-dependent siderophore receptor n=1 Tax=Ferrimonas sp. YFM TaxID=3028878 RepID=UPI0025742935|nr:TonB-dependent siderophore receptor [Ferrimonas sp. YFM]BDY04099.1 ferrisiderophore receptor [Ferrimonas sp. YFM]
MKPSYRWAACGVLLTAPVAAMADEMQDIERIEVVGQLNRYSATKTDTPIIETARSITIETQQQLLDKGVLSLDHSFNYSAGVTGQTYGFATRGDWIKVRGLDVPQYQDSLQSLFGNYNNTRAEVYTLEQVEILKGPASVLYGKGSPGGLVNVVSKLPKDVASHEVVFEYGTHDRKQFAFDSTGAITDDADLLYRVVGLWRDSDSQIDHVEDNTKVFAPSLTWRPTDASEITLLVNYTKTDSDPAAQFLPMVGTLLPSPNGKKIDASTNVGDPDFNNYDAETLSTTILASLDLNDYWRLGFTGRYTDAEADYNQAWTTFLPTSNPLVMGADRFITLPDGSLYKDGLTPRTFYISDASSRQTAGDIRLFGSFETGALEHELLMGIQYQDVTTDNDFSRIRGLGAPGTEFQQYGDTYWQNPFNPVYGSNLPPMELLMSKYQYQPSTNSTDLGIYISDQISLENWSLTLGLRYDDTETEATNAKQSDDAYSFSAGLIYNFDNGFAPYVSYAESFDPVIGDDGRGNPLKPQEGEQLEVGLKYQPNNFPALVTLAWFDIEQSNLSDPLSQIGEYQQQKGVAKITGLELESFVELGEFTVELNASKLDTEDPNGFRLASVPEYQASTWVGYRPAALDGFKSGLGVRYMGSSYDGADLYKTPSYTLMDLMVGYELEQWDFTLNVRNLTDKEYYATCLYRGDCFPGDERTINGRIKYVF